MTLLHKFRRLDIDFSRIGFIQADNSYKYFCTPANAAIIGRLGVDGIHYCTVDGYGEIIFAVNPIPVDDTHVYPVAQNFSDFLGLIIATGSANVLDQIYYMDKAGYEKFMSNPDDVDFLTAPQHLEIIEKIKNLGIRPVADPFEYVKVLQTDFDHSKITYSDEFYDITGIPAP